MTDINLLFAFGAGFLSFISPCTLPLYPAFLSYITGVSIHEIKEGKGIKQPRAMFHTLLFLLGFSIIFVALGMSTTLISDWFVQYKDILRQIGAILIVIFGLVITGIFKPGFLLKEKRIGFQKRPSGYVGSVLIGMGFAAGWTPCTGPILAAVIALGATNPEAGLLYMLVYTLGFAIPFFTMSFFIQKLDWFKKHSQKIMTIGGYLMIVMGIFLYFNWMTVIIAFLTNRVFGGFTGF